MPLVLTAWYVSGSAWGLTHISLRDPLPIHGSLEEACGHFNLPLLIKMREVIQGSS